MMVMSVSAVSPTTDLSKELPPAMNTHFILGDIFLVM